MAEKVTTRKATADDVPAIIELWKELMDFNKQCDARWTRAPDGHEAAAHYFTAHMEDEAFCILVAEADKRIVGYCLTDVRKCEPRLIDIDNYGHISNLVVTKDYRNQSIGQALIRELVKWFSEQNVRHIEVAVASSNHTARRFWSKMGFRPYAEVRLLEI